MQTKGRTRRGGAVPAEEGAMMQGGEHRRKHKPRQAAGLQGRPWAARNSSSKALQGRS